MQAAPRQTTRSLYCVSQLITNSPTLVQRRQASAGHIRGVDLPLWLLQCICEQQEACKLYRLHTKPHDPEMIHSLTETTAFCFPCRNRFAHTLKLKKLVVASTNKHHFLLSVITLIITFSTAADSDLACSPSNSGWEPVS